MSDPDATKSHTTRSRKRSRPEEHDHVTDSLKTQHPTNSLPTAMDTTQGVLDTTLNAGGEMPVTEDRPTAAEEEEEKSCGGPGTKDGSDNSNTEDEGSDWEGPVDVELEESPLDLKEQPDSTSSKASWTTVKALTAWTMIRPKRPWTQMAGHQGSFLAGTAGSVLKLLVPREEKNLLQMMEDSVITPHVPHYHGTIDKDGSRYVRLQDLLCEFSSPCVMDIKMGVRTYLEEELEKARKNPTPRNDLYQKMVSIDPEAPSEDEKENSAIDKPRYMKFRDDMSSTSALGFRIEGIKTQSGASKDYKNTRTRDDVSKALSHFVGDNATALEKYILGLGEVCKAHEASTFCKNHEMVGSSLLFVHDARGKAGVWMIDFAKCQTLPPSVSIDHRSPWVPGNYEDGYLSGLDNLKSIFEDLKASIENSQ
ncbi:inositol-trisphosphate 3-kinase A-like isoform X2 [Littorina saxatilis]|uniref:inositol-trisphosphate 3-kinase A-like isoform X2 n=1 Tax=Littorina saxatilis TaxID=31220 RepID=UPI0038B49189